MASKEPLNSPIGQRTACAAAALAAAAAVPRRARMFRRVLCHWVRHSVRPVLQLSILRDNQQIRATVNGDEQAPATPGLPRARSNAIALVEERMDLLSAEGLDGAMWDTLYAACAYCRSVGDKEGASAWAARAAENASLALGKDSLEFNKYAAYIGSRRTAKSNKGKPHS